MNFKLISEMLIALLMISCCNFHWPNLKVKAVMGADIELHPQQRISETQKVITTDE